MVSLENIALGLELRVSWDVKAHSKMCIIWSNISFQSTGSLIFKCYQITLDAFQLLFVLLLKKLTFLQELLLCMSKLYDAVPWVIFRSTALSYPASSTCSVDRLGRCRRRPTIRYQKSERMTVYLLIYNLWRESESNISQQQWENVSKLISADRKTEIFHLAHLVRISRSVL